MLLILNKYQENIIIILNWTYFSNSEVSACGRAQLLTIDNEDLRPVNLLAWKSAPREPPEN